MGTNNEGSIPYFQTYLKVINSLKLEKEMCKVNAKFELLRGGSVIGGIGLAQNVHADAYAVAAHAPTAVHILGLSLSDISLLIAIIYGCLQIAILTVKIPAWFQFWRETWRRWKIAKSVEPVKFPTLPDPLAKKDDAKK